MKSFDEWVSGLLEENERALVSFSDSIVHNLEVARDIVQEGFLKLCSQKRSSIESRMPQWLYFVCRNLAIDYLRKEGRMKNATNELLELENSEIPEDVLSKGDEIRSIQKAVSELNEQQQEIISLKYEHGLSYKMIAEKMKLSVSNVGFILHNVIKTLRESVERSLS